MPSNHQSQTESAAWNFEEADTDLLAQAISRLTIDKPNWLKEGNTYRVDGEKEINQIAKSHKIKKELDKIDLDAFSEFLAASAFLHCSDAWSLLGRSLDPLLLGDVTTCLHLCYYSELRGVMALLAAQGVYIGVRENILLRESDAFLINKDGTHSAALNIFKDWLDSGSEKQLLDVCIRPYGYALSEWGLTPPAAHIEIYQALHDVLEDIKNIDPDHCLRNSVSYRPLSLLSIGQQEVTVQQSVDDVRGLWEFLEPNESNPFGTIDRNLLVLALANKCADTHGQAGTEPARGFIEQVVPEDSLVEPILQAVEAESREESDHSTGLLSLSEMRYNSNHGDGLHKSVRGILIRALLLARIATGACKEILNKSDEEQSYLESWVGSLTESRGLVLSSCEVDSYFDLWADVRNALSALNECSTQDRFTFLQDCASKRLFPILSQAERVTAWSFSTDSI